MKKNINKNNLITTGIGACVVLGIGYFVGLQAGKQKFSDVLDSLAISGGVTLSKFIGGKEYILSITEKE